MPVPDIIRDSLFGYLVNHATGGRLFPYTEQRPDFVVPEKYLHGSPLDFHEKTSKHIANQSSPNDQGVEVTRSVSDASGKSLSGNRRSESITEKINEDEDGYPLKFESQDEERDIGVSPQKSEDPLANPDTDAKSINHGEYIMVDWYGPEDPDNPQNWSSFKSVWIIFAIAFLTVSIYMGSSIYTPGAAEMIRELNTTRVKAVLPLTAFIMGYAVGPMVLSPMSEHPPIGRNFIYLICLGFFCIIQVPTALMDTIEKIAGLRFLAGFAASPALSTGGATIGDVLTPDKLTIGLLGWAIGAFCGPTFGPLIGGVFSQLVGWRWCFWFLCILSGFAFCVLSLLLPETNHATILHRRAARLRKLTGNEFIRSPYELQEKMSTKDLIVETLWRPIFIAFFEPIVLALNMYCAFIYIIVNSWFEALPIVFEQFYGFNLIEGGVVYLAAIVGGIVGGFFYLLSYKRVLASENPNIEKFLIPSMIGSFFLPVAIFLFSWGSSSHTHWMAPVMSLFIFAIGAVFIFQSIFAYLGRGFYRYMASVFAGNCLVRSMMASVFPLFTYPMYENLATKDYPVGKAGSIWACVSALMVAIPFVIYHYGVQLRGRSKYAN